MGSLSQPVIHYEDNHLIVVEKTAGMLTQSDASGDISLMDVVKEYIRIRYDKPGNVFLGMVQRLDKPVSGLIMFAKTSKAASRLSRSIASREVIKLYLALVKNTGTVSLRIHEDRPWTSLHHHLLRKGDISILLDKPRNHTREASLSYKTLIYNRDYALLLVNLHTGRKHQIRAQLAHAGVPIINDTKYGGPGDGPSGQIGLHACFLEIHHPTRKIQLDFYSSPPEFFKERLTSKSLDKIIYDNTNELRYNSSI
jgi:23S rRNA pseudouridine1911/1915/1917 synthase